MPDTAQQAAPSTATTLGHHLQAFAEGVDAIMQDYTEESALIAPDGHVRGLDAIRGFFASFLNDSPPELLQAMALVRTEIAGELAYIQWKAEPFIPLAVDTFHIRDGKILVQTVTLFSAPTPVQPTIGHESRVDEAVHA